MRGIRFDGFSETTRSRDRSLNDVLGLIVTLSSRAPRLVERCKATAESVATTSLAPERVRKNRGKELPTELSPSSRHGEGQTTQFALIGHFCAKVSPTPLSSRQKVGMFFAWQGCLRHGSAGAQADLDPATAPAAEADRFDETPSTRCTHDIRRAVLRTGFSGSTSGCAPPDLTTFRRAT
jgi:hypothetical protein